MPKLTYAEFVKKTSMFRDRLQSPGGTWQAVLTAYQQYAIEPEPPQAGQRLYQALDDYLAKHGRGKWSNVDRDKESKGLLQRLHGELEAQKAKTREDILNSRFGVLYVLSQVHIDPNWGLGDVMEGLGAVGGAIGAGVGTQYVNVRSETASNIKVDLLGVKTTANTISGGGASGVGGVSTIVKAYSSSTESAKPFAPPTPAAPPTTAYQSFAGAMPTTAAALEKTAGAMSEVFQPSKYFSAEQLSSTSGRVAVGVGQLGAATLVAAGGTLAVTGALLIDAGRKLWELIKSAVQKGLQVIIGKQKTDPAWNYDKLIKVVGMITKVVCNFVMENAVPFISAGIDCVTGCVKAVDAVIDKVKLKLERGKFILMPGHPHLMADYIEGTTMNRLGAGLLECANGAAGIVTQVFAPGLGALVGAVTKAVAWAAGFIMKWMENTRLEQFLGEARALYARERERALAVAQRQQDIEDWERRMDEMTMTSRTRSYTVTSAPQPVKPPTTFVPPDPDSPFLANTAEFTRFFHRGCRASVLVPMVVLRSHICGSLMSFIKLTDPDGELRFDAYRAFAAGERYFTRLKQLSLKHFDDCGFVIKPRPDASEQGKATVRMIVGKLPPLPAVVTPPTPLTPPRSSAASAPASRARLQAA